MHTRKQTFVATQTCLRTFRQCRAPAASEGYGASLRSALQSAEDSARVHERSLWNAVDPDNTLTVGMQPIRTAANRVYGNLTAAAQAGLEPTERTILQVVNGYGGTERFPARPARWSIRAAPASPAAAAWRRTARAASSSRSANDSGAGA